MKIVILCAVVSLFVVPTAAEPRFSRTELLLGVSIEIPQNWWILSGDEVKKIESGEEVTVQFDTFEFPHGKVVQRFNAGSKRENADASMAVIVIDSQIPADSIKSATRSELSALEATLTETINRTLAPQNFHVLESLGIEVRTISGCVARVWKYRRSDPKGSVVVAMHTLYIGKKEIGLNLSYLESESGSWKSVIDHISQSIRVEKKG